MIAVFTVAKDAFYVYQVNIQQTTLIAVCQVFILTVIIMFNNNIINILEYCSNTKICFNKTISTSQMCHSNSSGMADSNKDNTISDYEQCPSINQCILQYFSFSPFACQVPAIIGFKYVHFNQ
jgi:hypothetical protein